MKAGTPPLVVMLLLFASCDEPSTVSTYEQPAPTQRIIPTGIQLAIGNKYHWQYTKTTNVGTFFRWTQTDSIVKDTNILGDNYFVFSSGKKLRCANHEILLFENDTSSIYYRFDVTKGLPSPFQGYSLPVSSVDTVKVFTDTVRVITLFSQGKLSSTLTDARYSTKFGALEINLQEPAESIRGVFIGARIGGKNYGNTPW